MKQSRQFYFFSLLVMLVFFSCKPESNNNVGNNDNPIDSIPQGHGLGTSQTDWPQLKPGENGLVPRYVAPKLKEIPLDKEHYYAGVFVVKFVEGSHVRLMDGVFQYDEKHGIQNGEELNRLGRVRLDPESVKTQVGEINVLVDEYKRKMDYVPHFLFRDKKHPLDSEDTQFQEKSVLEYQCGEELADLDLYYVMHAAKYKGGIDEQLAFMDKLNSFSVVEEVHGCAVVEGAVAKRPDKETLLLPPTPEISGLQTYLDPAPLGLNARYGWTIPGGLGDNVKAIDIEFDWVTDHEDFPTTSFFGGRPACAYDGNGSNHGTAVMGILASPHNALGIKGFTPNIQYGLNSVCRPFDYIPWFIAALFTGESVVGRTHNAVVANCINASAPSLAPGDILIIEQHAYGPGTQGPFPCTDVTDGQYGFVPMEYYIECFDAIRRATARGVIVVEAAGNGSQPLNAPRFRGNFLRSNRNSEAIMVGGVNGMGNLNAACFSNFGERLDVAAWGVFNVVTIGYGAQVGSPFDNPEINRFYTRMFSGTSSASPMVAGAVAQIQGVQKNLGRPVLSPTAMRNLLVSTGTAQDPATASSNPVGPQPNIQQALGALTTVTDGFTGRGTYFITNRHSGKVFDINLGFLGLEWGNNGRPLIQHSFHGGRNQQFLIEDVPGEPGFVKLTARHSDKVLDVTGSSSADGALLQQFDSNNGDNQKFRVEPTSDGFFKITAKNSTKALTLQRSTSDDNVNIVQMPFTGSNEQQFRFNRAD